MSLVFRLFKDVCLNIRIFVLYFVKRGTFISPILMDGTGRVGAPGRLIIWRPFKTTFFKFFGLRQGWRNCRGRVNRLADNLRRNSLACGNLSLLVPYFGLFHLRLDAFFSGWRPGSYPAGSPRSPALLILFGTESV